VGEIGLGFSDLNGPHPVLVSPGRRTSLGRASRSVGTGSERYREGRCGPSGPFCYSPVLSWLGPDPGVAGHAFCG